jgi:lipopolysaccharide transport system permease protein
VRYLLPFVLQAWMWLSPVAYSLELVPAAWRPLYALNPMVGVIQGFRWALVGSASPGSLLLISAAGAAALLAAGAYYFRRTEDHFADLI